MTAPPVDLLARATPLHRVDRLGHDLGFAPGRLWMKRDDLTGIAGGGNKARKLEWLVADALNRGCDALITSGALQSNHVRMTAAAAARHGLACHGVIYGQPPERSQGNLVLDDLLGLTAHVVADREDVPDGIAGVTDLVSGAGGVPYVIPGGGSSAVGAQGYVVAADEIRAAFPVAPLVVCAVGTAGTYAGLAVGGGHHADVMGVDVNAVPGIEDQIPELVAATATVAGRSAPDGSPTVAPGQPDPYGRPTALDHGRAAVGGRHRGHRARPRLHGPGHGGADRRLPERIDRPGPAHRLRAHRRTPGTVRRLGDPLDRVTGSLSKRHTRWSTNPSSWRRLRHSNTPSQWMPYSPTIESPVSQ